MKRLVIALVVIAAAFVPVTVQEDADLQTRVASLEAWRAVTDARLDLIETPSKAGAVVADAPGNKAEGILKVTIKNKRWDPSDLHATPTKYDDNIWWDATYEAIGLEKRARSIKGLMRFCDLFGDPQFQVRVTINKPIKPNGTVTKKGIGVDYNQFDESNVWLRTHDLKDMTFKFQVTHILYADGTSVKFQ